MPNTHTTHMTQALIMCAATTLVEMSMEIETDASTAQTVKLSSTFVDISLKVELSTASQPHSAKMALEGEEKEEEDEEEEEVEKKNIDEQDRVSIMETINCVLTRLYPHDRKTPNPGCAHPETLSMFDTTRQPSMTIGDYFTRIVKYTEVSWEAMVSAIRNLGRIVDYNPKFKVTAYNIHRLLLLALLTSAKFDDDRYFNNKLFATVGGIGIKEINRLEVEYLAMTNFDIFVPRHVHKSLLTQLRDVNIHSGCDCMQKFVDIDGMYKS